MSRTVTPIRLILVVALLAVLAGPIFNPPDADARSNNRSKPVLMVHGYNSNCGIWSDVRGLLYDQGYRNFKTVGYYNSTVSDGWHAGMCGLDVRKFGYSNLSNKSGTDKCNTSRQNGNVHDRDLSIRHIACEFAWTIYHNYSKRGVTVDVLAHSMGGLVTRWALGQVDCACNSAYPPYLLVEDVVTMGTPHNGSKWGGCWGCNVQIDQMDGDSGFIGQLQGWSRFDNPQPANGRGTATDWTVMGSTNDGLVSASSATDAGMPDARHQVVWKSWNHCSAPGHCNHYHGQVGHSDFHNIMSTNETAAVTRTRNTWNSWTDLDRTSYWPTRWAADSLYYGPNAARG